MKIKQIIFTAFLIFFAAPLVFSFGKKEEPKIAQVTGIVRLVGTAMFPEIVISGAYSGAAPDADNGGNVTEWYIAKEEKDKLRDLQHRRVTVEGEEIIIQMRFANGLSAGIRRELRNITIISVEL